MTGIARENSGGMTTTDRRTDGQTDRDRQQGRMGEKKKGGGGGGSRGVREVKERGKRERQTGR